MNKTGREAENLAVDYISQQGFRVIARNIKIGGFGEVDIVAEKNNVLCIFEVKALSYSHNFRAQDHFTTKKKQKVLRLAQHLGNLYNKDEIVVYLLAIDNFENTPLFHLFLIS